MKRFSAAIAVALCVVLVGCGEVEPQPTTTTATTTTVTTTETTTTTTATTTTTTKKTKKTKTKKPITEADLNGSYEFVRADALAFQRYTVTLDCAGRTVSLTTESGASPQGMVERGQAASVAEAEKMAVTWVTVGKAKYALDQSQTKSAGYEGLTTSGIALNGGYRIGFKVSEDGSTVTLLDQSDALLPADLLGVSFTRKK